MAECRKQWLVVQMAFIVTRSMLGPGIIMPLANMAQAGAIGSKGRR